MSNPNPNQQSKVPEFLRVDMRKDGLKLVVLFVAVGAAAYAWTQGTKPVEVAPETQALSAAAQLEVKREYQVPPLPQAPLAAAGKEPLINWVPVSRHDPFSALIKPETASPATSTSPVEQAGAMLDKLVDRMMPIRPIEPVTKQPYKVTVKKQVLPSSPVVPADIRVLGIGEGGGVYTALIQVGKEGSIVGIGDTIGKDLKVKGIFADKVILLRGKESIIRFLEEDGGAGK